MKFGIDGGNGFLKVCLSVQFTDDDASYNEPKGYNRQKYEDGVCAKDFKSTGVKKLFILAISQCTQENYDNVAEIWKILKINNFIDSVATDLKLANILAGIQAHSSTYPCTWCEIDRHNLKDCGIYRTFENVLNNYNAWMKNGSNIKNAKNFKSCIHLPILSSDKKSKILDVISPPELHLMIGVISTLIEHMGEEFKELTENWISKCDARNTITYGSSGFNGKESKKLLVNVPILRAMCEKANAFGCMKYVQVFEDFEEVVDDCFKVELNSKFLQSIEKLQTSYVDLKISVTPKVDAVFHHVKDFCSQRKMGLGYYSEQAMESVHFDFAAMWCNYCVHENHPDYEKRLFRAIIEYNSSHI